MLFTQEMWKGELAWWGWDRQREGGEGQTEKSSQAGKETRTVPVTIAA